MTPSHRISLPLLVLALVSLVGCVKKETTIMPAITHEWRYEATNPEKGSILYLHLYEYTWNGSLYKKTGAATIGSHSYPLNKADPESSRFSSAEAVLQYSSDGQFSFILPQGVTKTFALPFPAKRFTLLREPVEIDGHLAFAAEYDEDSPHQDEKYFAAELELARGSK